MGKAHIITQYLLMICENDFRRNLVFVLCVQVPLIRQ